jgi:hypothetical protein
MARVPKYVQPAPAAGIAAKLSPNPKYRICTANGYFRVLGVASERPLSILASGGSGSIAAGECRLPNQGKTGHSWMLRVRFG